MRFLPLAVAALGLVAHTAPAQEISRPKLPKDLDTNDARDYYSWGNRPNVSWKDAYAAYYWAWRLEPQVTDYLYAHYRALWFRQSPQWRAEYRKGAKYVRSSKDSRRLDSLYTEVLRRDPFPHLSGPCVWPDGIETVRDPLLAGYVFLDNGCYQQAAEKLAAAASKSPVELPIRLDRAYALFVTQQFAAAGRELQVVLDSLRARDETYVGQVYNSKEMLEYMAGWTALGRRDIGAARAALGRALTENLAFYPAHATLAAVAMDEGDITTALAEAELAVGLAERDGVLRFDYGTYLLDAGRHAEAEVQLAKAMELEPHWAEVSRSLARAFDRQGKTPEAVAQYRRYIALAPKRLHVRARECADRIAELEAGGDESGGP